MTITATLVLALAMAERLSSIVTDKDEVANAVGLRDEEYLEVATAHLQGTGSPTFTLGGTNANYPGYGCLSGQNDVTVNDVDLAGCEAACVDDASCKSIDFYVDRTGHTCSVSYSDFADVGSTTGTTDCRFYEIDRTTTGTTTASFPAMPSCDDEWTDCCGCHSTGAYCGTPSGEQGEVGGHTATVYCGEANCPADVVAACEGSGGTCTLDGQDRNAAENQGPCCNAECTEARPTTDDHYCAEGAAGHGSSCWSNVVMCRATCDVSKIILVGHHHTGSGPSMSNHLDITAAAREGCVSGQVSGREALTGGAACSSETNVTCAMKYEQKSRSTHRVGQQDPHAAHGTAAPTESYSEAYDMVGELHLCEWRPQLDRCEAGKVLLVCPEEEVVEVAASGGSGTAYEYLANINGFTGCQSGYDITTTSECSAAAATLGWVHLSNRPSDPQELNVDHAPTGCHGHANADGQLFFNTGGSGYASSYPSGRGGYYSVCICPPSGCTGGTQGCTAPESCRGVVNQQSGCPDASATDCPGTYLCTGCSALAPGA